MADKKKTPTPPMSKKKAFAKHKKATGSYHKADPLHPMNRELTGRSIVTVKKSGGKVGCGNNRLY